MEFCKLGVEEIHAHNVDVEKERTSESRSTAPLCSCSQYLLALYHNTAGTATRFLGKGWTTRRHNASFHRIVPWQLQSVVLECCPSTRRIETTGQHKVNTRSKFGLFSSLQNWLHRKGHIFCMVSAIFCKPLSPALGDAARPCFDGTRATRYSIC